MEHKIVVGPAIATDNMSPNYPAEMMAAYQACRGCWKEIEVGETVYELNDGNAIHQLCAKEKGLIS